jgi:hypothetical protein
MWISEIDAKNHRLSMAIPLTTAKDKIRIKKRNVFNEYGLPVATKVEPFSQRSYVEWQISYDALLSDTKKLERTTIKDKIFWSANGKRKTLYELSEYIYYFYVWNVVKPEDIISIKQYLEKLHSNDFLDVDKELQIERSHPVEKQILGIDFYYTQVKYPLLIHRFGEYEILTEIAVKEKQYAVGVQPMLYLCFPVTELDANPSLLGRTARTNEVGTLIIDENNIQIFLQILKIFGTLSKSHNMDVLSIIDVILTSQVI